MTRSKRVLPSQLSGSLRIPASKSIAHRAVICAALARGTSRIRGLTLSQDIQVTMECMKALGARMQWEEDVLVVQGAVRTRDSVTELYCGESGSTLRFMIPIAAAVGGYFRLDGAGRLGERPLDIYEEVLPEHGVSMKRGEKTLPLEIAGKLTGGTYQVRGDISSQFITGLLLALPLLDEDSEIRLSTPLESEPYVRLTLSAMAAFGVTVERLPDGYRIRGGQSYTPCEYTVEGDFSQAAFIVCAASLAASPEGVSLLGLNPATLQGDAAILNIVREMGGIWNWDGDRLVVYKARQLKNITVDASQCPDLVPVAAALGCCAQGEMHIIHAARLRIKESDRLSAVHTEYAKIGARIEESEDTLKITGAPQGYEGGEADSENDHRMAMSLAVLAQHTQNGILIGDAMSVRKSWPEFWQDYARIGGSYE